MKRTKLLLLLSALLLALQTGCAKKANTVKRHKPPHLVYQTLKDNAPYKETGEFSKSEIQELLEEFESAYYSSSDAIEKIEQLAKEQGTGEITIFFPVNRSVMPKGEVMRLTHFLDNLVMARMGRKIYLICIGSASAFGSKSRNRTLAIERSQAPIELMEKHLVKVPHEFLSVFGTGDVYSAKNVRDQKVHDRFQHVRILALYGP